MEIELILRAKYDGVLSVDIDYYWNKNEACNSEELMRSPS